MKKLQMKGKKALLCILCLARNSKNHRCPVENVVNVDSEGEDAMEAFVDNKDIDVVHVAGEGPPPVGQKKAALWSMCR